MLTSQTAPVNPLVEYETRTFYRSRGDNKSPFQGWPDDEKDRLWLESYHSGLFTYVDREAAMKLPNVTSRVAEPGLEDQYMVVLDVFHQLHCLNFIRQAFYPERYGRSMYHKDGTLDYSANLRLPDHCIDQVRQSLMCSADTSIIPVQWNDATKSMRPRVDTIHTCKKYDQLLEWTIGRNLSDFRGAALVVEDEVGGLRIEDYLEDKATGKIQVAESECHAI
ncbi:oxidase ustYa family protein [Aspergillus brunneoviolaceus CBS 621.78]|uniref:Uncharacterized protein n=1 Tax=Aspergillus brunneoviolaceus CBS 621.78 TaxID=1450534 RepID=A0ACD1GAL5_9EURO|nr:hypothetical protein BO95DRAFT_361969 [Aspergillus brunneoviolaceus CBS 621.78]RAH46174.1 hypothetical protein BO95DRAFT_361969 [Aspergillus brunneoviolaceus CBS 621.78]